MARRGADLGCELSLQREIHRTALEIAESARNDLVALARRSRRISARVCCDQEEWPAIIADCVDDMLGDTFDCLPDAIARARRTGEPDE